MKIGQYHILEVLRDTSVGLYLGDGVEELLLPIRYIPDGTKIGDKLNVFVYLDSDDRPIATTLKPFALVNEYAFLVVKEVNNFGAFLDWGIAKDLFVPYAEQREPMVEGKEYLVYIFQDEFSGRISGSSKWMRFIETNSIPYQEKEKVNLLIAERTELGFRAIINMKHEGMLYMNELFEQLQPGDSLTGYIKKVRPDNKIDLSLQLPGMEHIQDTREQILYMMENGGGFMPLGDKSNPEDIYRILNISKKVFKKTIGTLYKERKITISDKEIRLTPADPK